MVGCATFPQSSLFYHATACSACRPPDDPQDEAVHEVVQLKNDVMGRNLDDAMRVWEDAGEMPKRISPEDRCLALLFGNDLELLGT